MEIETMHDKPWDARLAAALVRPFLHLPQVHPNHFTTLRLLIGLAGTLAFASGEWPNLAAWLVVLSNFLDHTDGEYARMSGKTSRFGHVYDLVSDALITVGLFAGIGVGLAADDHSTFEMLLGLLAGGAVAIIFHLRNQMESALGKSATRQPRWANRCTVARAMPPAAPVINIVLIFWFSFKASIIL